LCVENNIYQGQPLGQGIIPNFPTRDFFLHTILTSGIYQQRSGFPSNGYYFKVVEKIFKKKIFEIR